MAHVSPQMLSFLWNWVTFTVSLWEFEGCFFIFRTEGRVTKEMLTCYKNLAPLFFDIKSLERNRQWKPGSDEWLSLRDPFPPFLLLSYMNKLTYEWMWLWLFSCIKLRALQQGNWRFTLLRPCYFLQLLRKITYTTLSIVLDDEKQLCIC